MKKYLGLLILLCTGMATCPQPTGIGTITPHFKVDVKGGSINTDSLYRINSDVVLSVKGTQNTFTGIQAGVDNTGRDNTALGYKSMFYNATGNHNTGIGHRALYWNETSSDNTASGYIATLVNKGYANTVSGSGALLGGNFPNAPLNTAFGFQTLYSVTTASSNVAYGAFSLFSTTNGYTNVAAGHGALYSTQSGVYNTAIGYNALFSNKYSHNTAIGRDALYSNTDGRYNTAAGYQALYKNSTSEYNTAVGYVTANSFNTGYNNTVVGADAELSLNNQYNSIGIGNLANCPDNSTVRIGNSANWSYGGYANWTNISDGRYKTNVQENVPGLHFIKGLRPVTYRMNVTGLNKQMSAKDPDDKMIAAMIEKENMTWTGFVAQEVEMAAKVAGFTFSGVDKPRTDDGIYGLRYDEFVVPLVKAVQEQQAMIDSLQDQLRIMEPIILQMPGNRQKQIKLLRMQNEALMQQYVEEQKRIDILLRRLEQLEIVVTQKTAK